MSKAFWVFRVALATVLATLEIEELNFYMKTDIIDTITTLQDSDGEVILIQKIRIHYILDKGACKWVGNTAHVLAFLF